MTIIQRIKRFFRAKPKLVWTNDDEKLLREARRLHRPTKHLSLRKTEAIHAELRASSRWRGA